MSDSLFQVEQNAILQDMKQFVKSDALNLEIHKVEESLFRTLLRLGKAFLQEAIENHGSGKVDGKISNGEEDLPYHSIKSNTYLSIFGEIKYYRAYYWTTDCTRGVHPLDAKLNMPESKYSYYLGNFLNRGVADQTYEEVLENYKELFGVDIPKKSLEVIAISAGKEFDKYVINKEAPDQSTEGKIICIQADCKGIRMVASEKPDAGKTEATGANFKKGKGEKDGLRKMAVATGDYSFNPQPRTPEELIEALMKDKPDKDREKEKETKRTLKEAGKIVPGEPINTQVSASLAGKKVAFEELVHRILQRDPTKSKPIVALIDGEKALESELISSLNEAGQIDRLDCVILDVIHMIEYLWKAGTSLYGEKGKARLLWVRTQGLSILKGNVGRVIGALRQMIVKNDLKKSTQNVLNTVITYFMNHKHMMKYNEYLEKGYPIATGFIEGTCGSLIRDRTDKSGSRWSSVGVQSVLNLRAAKKNGWWNGYYKFHIEEQRVKLYGPREKAS